MAPIQNRHGCIFSLQRGPLKRAVSRSGAWGSSRGSLRYIAIVFSSHFYWAPKTKTTEEYRGRIWKFWSLQWLTTNNNNQIDWERCWKKNKKQQMLCSLSSSKSLLLRASGYICEKIIDSHCEWRVDYIIGKGVVDCWFGLDEEERKKKKEERKKKFITK